MLAIVQKATQEVDQQVAELVVKLARDLLAYVRSEAGAPSRSVALSKADVLRQLSPLVGPTERARLEDLIETAVSQVASEVGAYRPARGFEPVASREVLKQVRQSVQTAVNFWTDEAPRLSAHIQRALVAGDTLAELEQQVRVLTGQTRARVKARVFTALSMAQRATTVAQAEAAPGSWVFVYVGNDDRLTRPFCDRCLGQAWTREALDRLDNGPGQPKPVSIALGGYNCRHSLAPMLLQVAQARRLKINT